MNEQELQKLFSELQNGSDQQRRAAAYKLGKSKNLAAVPALIKAYHDKDSSVRQNVIGGLKNIGSPEALDFLNSLANSPSVAAEVTKTGGEETDQAPKAATPTTIHVRLALVKDRTEVAMLGIPRDAVEHPSKATRDELNQLVDGIAARCVKERILIKIAPTIDGYNNDPRELFEVPEVCAWARDILNQLPGLWGFLDKGSQDFLVVWSCGPLSRNEMVLPKYQALFKEKRLACIANSNVAFPELLKKAGASEELIKNFYRQLIFWQLPKN